MKPFQDENRKLTNHHRSKILTIEDKQTGNEFNVCVRSEEEEQLIGEILSKEIRIKLNLSYGGNSSKKKQARKSILQMSLKRPHSLNNNKARAVQDQIEKISELSSSEEVPTKMAKTTPTSSKQPINFLVANKT